MKIPLIAICAGAASTLPTGKSSGIYKQALVGRIKIGARGIEIDEQVDRKHHGYPAMALHQFPHEHYAWLRYHFGEMARLGTPGSMGQAQAVRSIEEDTQLQALMSRFDGELDRASIAPIENESKKR